MAVDSKTRQDIIDVIDELGASVDSDIEEVQEIDDKVTLPGIKTDGQGNFISYCLAKMTVFHAYVKTQADAIRAAWDTWFGADVTSGVQKIWNDLKNEITTATGAATSAANNVQTAVNAANEAASNANTKASLANEKAALANEKASLADQKAAAANTAAENATSIWNTVKNWFNGNSGFKATAEAWYNSVTAAWTNWFGASASAGVQKDWADLRADVVAKTGAANTAAENANTKASLANEKAALANEKASLAEQKATLANEKAGYAEEEGDRAKAYLDALQGIMTDEARELLLGSLCAPHIEGSTLVFPAMSTARFENSTLILAE